MMQENMKIFLEAVSKNEELRERMKAADESNVTAVALEIAKELGIPLTEADFEKPAPAELSDDELEAVSGGDNECMCFAGGGGGGTMGVLDHARDVACACVAYGQGDDSVKGTLCMCVAIGVGDFR